MHPPAPAALRSAINAARRMLLLTAALFACALLACAQVGTGGTILGTVSDPSGASVPNVAITITNTDTNAVTHITSNDRGEYVAPDLQIGRYNVRAEAPGFKVTEQKNVLLNVGDRRDVDIKMELGRIGRAHV